MMLLWAPTVIKYLGSPVGVFLLKAAAVFAFCAALFITGANHQRKIDDVKSLQARNAALQLALDVARRDSDVAHDAADQARQQAAALDAETSDLAGKLAAIQSAASIPLAGHGPCLVGAHARELRGIK
jgi:hypothetical protein